jgi:hypothetical protein
MSYITKHLRLLAIAAAFALAVQPLASLSTSTPAHATDIKYSRMMMSAVEGGSSSGGWIIGGLFFSVASIIACAMIVGSEEDREMTLEEALLSGAIPLGCLFREHLSEQ